MTINVLEFNELKKFNCCYRANTLAPIQPCISCAVGCFANSIVCRDSSNVCYNNANTCWNNVQTLVANACATYNTYNNPQSLANTYFNYFPLGLKCFYADPFNCSFWNTVPALTTVTGSLNVCDAGSNFSCGVCCAWTVPAGATWIRFQLWGAGASSSGASCCGFSAAGTGAYASVIIPATPGCVYTVCSGCAYNPGTCCFGNPGAGWGDQYGYRGYPSYVTGYGLSNFCAEGGSAAGCDWVKSATCRHQLTDSQYFGDAYSVKGADCVYPGHSYHTNSYGCSTYCSNFFCSYYGCGTYNVNACDQATGSTRPYRSQLSNYYGTTSFSPGYSNPLCPTYDYCVGFVYGMNGSWPSLRIGATYNLPDFICLPPIFGLACGCCIPTPCTIGYCGGATCNESCAGAQAIPSAGGYPAWTCGGTCIFGARGRMGMVTIQWT